MKIIQILICVLLLSSLVHAQKKVDLKLNQVSKNATSSCYNIELSSPFGEEIVLAGQNFRIFYDASKTNLIEKSITYEGSKDAYSKLEKISTVQDNIGFLSMSIDGRANNEQTLVLDHRGNWLKVASVCFESKNNQNFDLVWANERTEHFASAEVALSEWVDNENQAVLNPNLMIDFMANQHSVMNSGQVSMEVYPNPLVNFINIDINELNENVELIIKDVIGREVVYDNVSDQSKLYYDLSNWPSGRYTIELIGEDGKMVHTESVIKTVSGR